ncbi:hypothetical protein FRC08_003764 [Ceratobasidium sp. 394]|nr:hypothetical protein FRC08_003764 [Ceratobasidium sp. 394]
MLDWEASSSPAKMVAMLLGKLQGMQSHMAKMEALLANIIPDYHQWLESLFWLVIGDEPLQDDVGDDISKNSFFL